VEDLLVRAQFDLRGDPQAGLDRVDLVGTVLVLLHHLGAGHAGQAGKQQRHAGADPQKRVATHHGCSPSCCSVCACGTAVSAASIPWAATAGSAVAAGSAASTGSTGNSRSGTGTAAKSSSTR